MLHAGVMAEERGAAIPGRGANAVVVSGEKHRPVSAEGMSERADTVAVDLLERKQYIDGDRVLVGELADRGPFRVLLVEAARLVRAFGRRAVSGNEMVSRCVDR